MNMTHYKAAARALDADFTRRITQHLTPQEIHYLQQTPTVRKNLLVQIHQAFANTFLTPEEQRMLPQLTEEDLEPLLTDNTT